MSPLGILQMPESWKIKKASGMMIAKLSHRQVCWHRLSTNRLYQTLQRQQETKETPRSNRIHKMSCTKKNPHLD